MKLNFKKDNLNFNIAITVFAFVVTCIFIYTGTILNSGYKYKIGDISNKRFYAEKESVNQVATNKLKKEAINSVATIYTHDTQIDKNIYSELDSFFKDINSFSTTEFEINSTSAPIGVTSNIYLTYEQILFLQDTSLQQQQQYQSDIVKILEKQLNTGVRNDTVDATLSSIKENIEELGYSYEATDILYVITSDILKPNLIIDEDATKKAQEEKADAIEPVMVLKNQKIIDEGEIITDEIYSILDGQGYIKKDSILQNLPYIISNCIIIFLLLFTMCFYLYSYNFKIWTSKSNMLFIYTLYFICIATSLFISNYTSFLIPIIMCTALISLIFEVPTAIVINFIFTIISGLIYDMDNQFLIYFTAMGTISAFAIKYYTERVRLIYIAVSSSIIAVILNLCLLIVFDAHWQEKALIQSIYAFSSITLSYVLLTGSLPIWEGIFGLVTNLRLEELINPNTPLMHRLMLEAPGTYHHSLVVSNLAEAAAYNINANPTLAKVGAYYHDIGKLYAPNYFTENIRGESPHINLTPEESAKIITAHTTNGVILGKKHKLPNVILNIISEHHGTTLAKYFYITAKNENINIDKKLFQYKGPIPSSKESAIIMMADIAEAAIRSKTNDKLTYEEMKDFIRELITEKLNDGQFVGCDITFKDLENIIDGFMDIFKGMYHQRISYPKEAEV